MAFLPDPRVHGDRSACVCECVCVCVCVCARAHVHVRAYVRARARSRAHAHQCFLGFRVEASLVLCGGVLCVCGQKSGPLRAAPRGGAANGHAAPLGGTGGNAPRDVLLDY